MKGWYGILYGIKERSTSRSRGSTPGEIGPSSHWVELLFGPNAGLDAVEKKENPLPGNWNLADTNMIADECAIDTGLIILHS
jgi:hypothetical protein